MKNLMILLVLGFTTTYAQFFTVGPRVGVSSSQVTLSEAINQGNNIDNYLIENGARSVGYHGGLFARVSLLGFYVQPELLFSSTGGELDLTNTDTQAKDIIDLTYNRLDVPIMVGKTFASIVRVNVGPSFMVPLGSSVTVADGAGLAQTTQEELESDFQNAYENATVGFQAGVGLDIWKIVLDLKYEGSLGKYADNIGGFNTDQRANQWLVSVGFKLL